MEITLYRVCSSRVLVLDELEQPLVADSERLPFAKELLDDREGLAADVVAFLAQPRVRRKGRGSDVAVRFVTRGSIERPVDEAGILAAADYARSRIRQGSSRSDSLSLVCETSTTQPREYTVQRRAPINADLAERYNVNLGPLVTYEPATFAGVAENVMAQKEYLRISAPDLSLQVGETAIRGRLDGFIASLGEPHLVLFCGDEIPEIGNSESRDSYLNDLLEGCFTPIEASLLNEAHSSHKVLDALGGYFANSKSIFPVPSVIAARPDRPNKVSYVCHDRGGDGKTITCGTAGTVTGALATVLDLCQTPLVAQPISSNGSNTSPYEIGSMAVVAEGRGGWVFEGSVKKLLAGRWH